MVEKMVLPGYEKMVLSVVPGYEKRVLSGDDKMVLPGYEKMVLSVVPGYEKRVLSGDEKKVLSGDERRVLPGHEKRVLPGDEKRVPQKRVLPEKREKATGGTRIMYSLRGRNGSAIREGPWSHNRHHSIRSCDDTASRLTAHLIR